LGVKGGRGAFGDLLCAHRQAAGLTQEELAGQCGLSVRALADMERGRTARPYRRSVALLADALGLSGEEGVLFARTARAGAAAGTGAGRSGSASTPGAAQTTAVPRQLPAAVPGFAGREAELRALADLLGRTDAGPGTVVISAIAGTAGVGKTALAVYWGHQVADLFPDGQLYVNLRGFDPSGVPVTPAAAVRGFLDALGVPPGQVPAGLDAQAGLYRSVLAGRRMLIVLDNARDPAQVRPLLPASPGCLVLVTSRNQLSGLAAADGARLLTLDVLTVTEARDLLARRLGDERIAAEPAAVAEMAGLCVRLPLALAIAAARAAARPGLPLAALAAELRGTRNRLGALGAGDPATDVRTALSWSCRQLSEPAARMFRLLGLHPGPDTTAAAAASLVGVPPGQARQALAELASAHMITEYVPGRYAFHDLLRAYAEEQAARHDSDTTRHAAVHRILDHYLHTAASLLLHPHRNPVTLGRPQPQVRPEELTGRQQALEWFQAERQVLLAAISQAADSGFGTHAWQLPWAAAMFFDWQGYWQEMAATQQVALAAARGLGDRDGQFQACRFLGRARMLLGSYAEADTHLAEALDLGRQLGSGILQARVHVDLAVASERQGRHGDGLCHAEQALLLFRAAGHRWGEALARDQAGWIYARLGAYQEALEYCGQALAVHRELGNKAGQGITLDSLGYAHHHLGHHAEAIACYQQAIDVLGDDGYLQLRANALVHLGDACQATGGNAAARRAWQQALAILDNLHHPAASQVRGKLGTAATVGAAPSGRQAREHAPAETQPAVTPAAGRLTPR
jgi:tetratricopeptide (TPR) repeat protein/transcriptional regulator with XRE-family HTH domain